MDLEKLKQAALAATPGPWMRLFGERTVYTRLEDGCRGIAVARADIGYSYQDGQNLDYVAVANPTAILELIERLEKAEKQRDYAIEVMHKVVEDLIVGKSDDLVLADSIRDAIASIKES